MIGLRVRPESRDRLDAVAARLGVDRSEAARRALAAGLPVLEAFSGGAAAFERERVGRHPEPGRHPFVPGGPNGRCAEGDCGMQKMAAVHRG